MPANKTHLWDGVSLGQFCDSVHENHLEVLAKTTDSQASPMEILIQWVLGWSLRTSIFNDLCNRLFCWWSGNNTLRYSALNRHVALGCLVPPLGLGFPLCETGILNEYFSLRLHQAFQQPHNPQSSEGDRSWIHAQPVSSRPFWKLPSWNSVLQIF